MAFVLNDLALLYSAQDQFFDAEPLFERALTIRERSLVREDPDLVISLENYAALLRETGRNAEAVNMESRAKANRAKHAEEKPAIGEGAPRLIDSEQFQKMAARLDTPAAERKTSCACFDRPRLPQQYALPILVESEGARRWDCPREWVATCRVDVKGRKNPPATDMPIQGVSGIWKFSVQPFNEHGTSPEILFDTATFHGELGPEGEGVPFGPYVPDWAKRGGGVILDLDLRKSPDQ